MEDREDISKMDKQMEIETKEAEKRKKRVQENKRRKE